MIGSTHMLDSVEAALDLLSGKDRAFYDANIAVRLALAHLVHSRNWVCLVNLPCDFLASLVLSAPWYWSSGENGFVSHFAEAASGCSTAMKAVERYSRC